MPFQTQGGVLGGVPEGSILGVSLFNCSRDSFEMWADDVRQYQGGSGTNTTAPGGPNPLPVSDEPTPRNQEEVYIKNLGTMAPRQTGNVQD